MVGWAAAGGGAGATVGGSIAWFVDNGVTADWFGAIGTWVGAIGTIATIGWAVITFQHQQGQKRQEEIAAAVARREEELAKAKGVTVSCRPAYWVAGVIERAYLDFANPLAVPVKVLAVRIGPSEIPKLQKRPLMIDPGSTTEQRTIVPSLQPAPGEKMAAFPDESHVEMTYEIDNVRWSRTGTGDPVRL